MTQPGNCFHSSFPVWLRNKEGSCRGSHPGEDCVASSWRNLRMGDSGPERHGCPMSYLKCSCWASSLTSYICIHGLRLTTNAFTVVVLSDAMTVMYAAKVIFLFEHYPLFYFLSLKDEEIAAQATKGIAPGVSVVAQSCPTLCDPMDCSTPRLPCLSPSPGVCSSSCPLSQWRYPTISSSVITFSSCLRSFPASGSFLRGLCSKSDLEPRISCL